MAKIHCDTCDDSGWVYDDDDGGTKVCPDCDGEAGEEDDDMEAEELAVEANQPLDVLDVMMLGSLSSEPEYARWLDAELVKALSEEDL